MAKYKDVIVTAGSGGFGGPLHLHPNEKQNKIVNITGGVISPVAKRLAEMTGCELVDGFKTSVPDEEILAVVIDCGGTLRCGIYPQKRIQTINLNPTGPSGPLAQFIKPDIYVSAVREKDLAFAEETDAAEPAAADRRTGTGHPDHAGTGRLLQRCTDPVRSGECSHERIQPGAAGKSHSGLCGAGYPCGAGRGDR